MQWRARAASTAGVLLGHGPSSKVSTTSPGFRKSWLLKCSKPKPGPPVVSTCTVRVSPSASGLPGQETGCGAGAGGGALTAGAGAGGAAGVPEPAGAWATVVPPGAAGGFAEGACDGAGAVTATVATVMTGSAGGLAGVVGCLAGELAAVAGALPAVAAGGDNILVLVSATAARTDSTTRVQATITRIAKPPAQSPRPNVMQTRCSRQQLQQLRLKIGEQWLSDDSLHRSCRR